MPTIGTNVAIIDSGQILLIKRADFRLWSLPGGDVEAGETVAQTAVREAREETGLEVQLVYVVGVYSRPKWHKGGNHAVLFVARTVGGTLMQDVDGEALDARYFEPDGLPEALVWWHRQRIHDALNRSGGGVVWRQDAVWPQAAAHPGPEHEFREV